VMIDESTSSGAGSASKRQTETRRKYS